MASSSIPPILPEEEEPSRDDRAKEEVDALALRRELEATERRQEHLRAEKLRNLFAKGVRCLITLIFSLVACALIVVAWHYLTPASWHWVEDEALGTVSTVLFSGTLFVFLGLYVRDRVSS